MKHNNIEWVALIAIFLILTVTISVIAVFGFTKLASDSFPIYHHATVTSTITEKFTSTEWHLVSILPFNQYSYETIHYFQMASGDTLRVSGYDYDHYQIGDEYTFQTVNR